MTGILAIIIIFLCILGEAFFSGTEIALVSVDRMQLKHAAKSGHSASKLVSEMLKNPERILGTTLFGTNLCVVISTTVVSSQLYLWLGAMGVPVAIFVMTSINLVFAEIVPKSIFQQKSNDIVLRIIYILRFFMLLFFPVVWLFSQTASLIALIFGEKRVNDGLFISKEELKLMMKMRHDTGDVKPSERKMINRLLHFTETSVREIMIPLIDVAVMSDKATIQEAAEYFVQTKHRRIPVYRDRVDKIVGVLNSFDILGENPSKSIKSLIRPAYYVPVTMGIAKLLEDLQNDHQSMAVVVDEFGGAEGVVTIEDILEEVVGDIEDEYDEVENLFRLRPDGTIVVSGRMPVDDINDRFGFIIPEGEYETIGGFFLHRTQRIPKVGEKIRLKNAELVVTKANSRIIGEIAIRRSDSSDQSS
ncbi:MAG TPA: HlyC/CorC family transporter [Candidatus Marinimicrobia bacterium]|nr:HlyC/CorC family transporter [Candidatus Neomarinimicrobiota bacterium]